MRHKFLFLFIPIIILFLLLIFYSLQFHFPPHEREQECRPNSGIEYGNYSSSYRLLLENTIPLQDYLDNDSMMNVTNETFILRSTFQSSFFNYTQDIYFIASHSSTLYILPDETANNCTTEIPIEENITSSVELTIKMVINSTDPDITSIIFFGSDNILNLTYSWEHNRLNVTTKDEKMKDNITLDDSGESPPGSPWYSYKIYLSESLIFHVQTGRPRVDYSGAPICD